MNTPDAAGQAAAGPAASSGELPASLPVGALISALSQELSHAIQERLHLIVLEGRQIGLQVTQMIMLAVLAALMACAAWATVLVAIYLACTAHGMPWGVALLVVLLVNIGAAYAIWSTAYRIGSRLGFPATLRMLQHLGQPHPGPQDPPAPTGVVAPATGPMPHPAVPFPPGTDTAARRTPPP